MKKKIKTICVFCMKSHKNSKPMLCAAKSEIYRRYLTQGLESWQIIAGFESGIINLESEAQELVDFTKKCIKESRTRVGNI